MSKECKIVKGTSLFMLVFGIIAVVGGIFMFANAPAAAGVEGVDDPVVTARALGIVMAVMGVVYFATGVVGARGANNPAKLRPFVIMGTVVALINLFEVAMCVMTGAAFYQNLIYAVFALVGVVYASRALKAARDRI